jgi:hypothetical protein
VFGDFLDIHTPGRGSDERKPARLAVEHEAQINLASDVRPLFDVDLVYRQAFRPGLVGHQARAEHGSGRRCDRIEILGELDAARLAAAAGMDLGFDDPGCGPQPAGRRNGFLGRGGRLAFRHRNGVFGK